MNVTIGCSRMICRCAIGFALLIAAAAGQTALASTAGPYIKVLKGGKLPAARLAPIIKLVCSRGDGEDLAYVLEETLRPGGYEGEARRAALEGLVEAAAQRNVKPDGDLAGVAELLQAADEPDEAAQVLAARLAGLWQVSAAGTGLAALAENPKSSRALRGAALQALAEIDRENAKTVIGKLATPALPAAVRWQALGVLARIDLDAAAALAALEFQRLTPRDQPTPLVQAFLDEKAGAQKLAGALAKASLSPDAAKVVLRSVYALGRTDAELLGVLTTAAGISSEVKPLTPEELKAYSADVAAKGDAARGERVFRRAELSCLKCHALNGAGGQVGPDLVGLGGSSPNDYLVEAILMPDKAVKEEYQVITVLTDEGQVLTGIAKERDDQKLIIKDATGTLRTIPADSIEDEVKGGSLMPKGLASFLTRDDFLDLVKFLSELGRPGGNYERNTTPVVRRWRVWRPEESAVTASVPDEALFREQVLGEGVEWQPLYSLCSGELPLEELAQAAPASVVYLQTQIQVQQPGDVALRLNASEGLAAWIDETPLNIQPTLEAELTAGIHTLTLRVDLAVRKAPIRVELVQSEDSSADAALVGGQ